jgi:hypothetical protein
VSAAASERRPSRRASSTPPAHRGPPPHRPDALRAAWRVDGAPARRARGEPPEHRSATTASFWVAEGPYVPATVVATLPHAHRADPRHRPIAVLAAIPRPPPQPPNRTIARRAPNRLVCLRSTRRLPFVGQYTRPAHSQMPDRIATACHRGRMVGSPPVRRYRRGGCAARKSRSCRHR